MWIRCGENWGWRENQSVLDGRRICVKKTYENLNIKNMLAWRRTRHKALYVKIYSFFMWASGTNKLTTVWISSTYKSVAFQIWQLHCVSSAISTIICACIIMYHIFHHIRIYSVMTLRQLHDCPSVYEIILYEIGKIGWYTATAKQSKWAEFVPCIVYRKCPEFDIK